MKEPLCFMRKTYRYSAAKRQQEHRHRQRHTTRGQSSHLNHAYSTWSWMWCRLLSKEWRDKAILTMVAGLRDGTWEGKPQGLPVENEGLHALLQGKSICTNRTVLLALHTWTEDFAGTRILVTACILAKMSARRAAWLMHVLTDYGVVRPQRRRREP